MFTKQLYHDRQRGMYELFDEYHLPLLKNIDHHALIK